MLTKYNNREQAEAYLKNNYVDKHDKSSECTLIIDARLTDLVRDNIVEPVIAKSASRLAMLISYRNVAYTTTDEMAEILEIAKSNLSREVKSLDKNGLLVVLANKGTFKPERTLVFNPILFWRGSYKVKDIWEEKIIIGGYDWQTMKKDDVDEKD